MAILVLIHYIPGQTFSKPSNTIKTKWDGKQNWDFLI